MTTILQKLSAASLGTAILAVSAATPASAATFNISGGFVSNSPTLPVLDNVSFKGAYSLSDSGVFPVGIPVELTSYTVSFFAPSGYPLLTISSSNSSSGQGIVTAESSGFDLQFSDVSGTLNIFGTGTPLTPTGVNLAKSSLMSYGSSIDVASATISSVLEPSSIAGFLVIGFGLLLRKKSFIS